MCNRLNNKRKTNLDKINIIVKKTNKLNQNKLKEKRHKIQQDKIHLLKVSK